MNKLKVLILVLSIIFLTACNDDGYEVLSDSDTISETIIISPTPYESIGVYVCGEVLNPGMYYFMPGARLEDAIYAAGGMTEYADYKSVNLAEYLSDCDKVYVPALGEDIDDSNSDNASDDGKVNINKASLDELMTLPGIGQSKAQSIIDYRTEYGEYKSVQDIMNITGIKEGVFNKIKDLIKV